VKFAGDQGDEYDDKETSQYLEVGQTRIQPSSVVRRNRSQLVIVKFGSNHIAAIAVIFLLVLPRDTQGGTKPVMVHYMPWFQNPYSLGTGNWGYHWTLNHFNPNTISPTNDEDEIASWYYPLIGPYDSSDPAVLEYHVLLMKLGGIDGMIVDWYGPDNYYDYLINNQRTLDIFNYAQKAGLKFSLCYEDSTIQAEINGGCMNGVCVTADNAITHAQGEMLYAQTNFFVYTNFLKWNNQPIFLNFGPQYFYSSADWTSIFSVLNASNQPAFFTENNCLAPAGQGAFDWPPMQLSQTNAQSPTEPVLSNAALTGYLAAFDASAAAWPAFVSTAFPRFHDIYAQAGVSPSYGYLPDQSGNTLRETLSRAMTNDSAVIQIATWNDYGEGTIIEPTVAGSEPTTEYGYTDLGIIQDFRRQYLEATFPYQTNDLALAFRLYNLRKQYLNNPPVYAELDRVFTNIIAGNLATASLQLSGMESSQPVIYNLMTNSNRLQFSIGGYLASGVQVEVSTNLVTWQSAQTFAATTNLLVFSTDTVQPVCRFFKVQQ
jgi:hypothetical protein